MRCLVLFSFALLLIAQSATALAEPVVLCRCINKGQEHSVFLKQDGVRSYATAFQNIHCYLTTGRDYVWCVNALTAGARSISSRMQPVGEHFRLSMCLAFAEAMTNTDARLRGATDSWACES